MFNSKYIQIRQKVNIIGSGIGGLSSAIRLASKGYEVTIFEKNNYPGGKLSEMHLGEFRFDKGPSLLTMPELITELSKLSPIETEFKYKKLETITHYFYEDGTNLKAFADINAFAKEVSIHLNEEESAVVKHLKKSKFYFESTADLFLHQSLHLIKNFINTKTLKGIFKLPQLGIFRTMHQQNSKTFKNQKTIQLFNRYATYNGSDPYKAPALLNIIPHLEFGQGAYIPEKGMHQITEHLVKLCENTGVQFRFNEQVETILLKNEKAIGIKSNGTNYFCDVVISDADIHTVYKKLLPQKYYPKKLLNQEKSSSAYVFYWGIKKEFKELGLHNILFSDNYKKEFEILFGKDAPYDDPTIYINITSKHCKEDAPEGSENWFVMVNVPHNENAEIPYKDTIRKNVITKINRILKTKIQDFIIEEQTLDPISIEQQTSSYGGSLYGNSSNNKFSAFLRHANFSSKIKSLYFVGGSVHPGGGIPLCLLSAKITSELISKREY